MNQHDLKTDEELAVYKAIVRLPLRLEELELLVRKSPMELMAEHRLDHAQVMVLSAWTKHEIQRYRAQDVSGNRDEAVSKFLASLV
jgi:hypothetical protein